LASQCPSGLTVLYLAGSGRSGTTLISHILDQLDGVFAGGELRYVWERGLERDDFCGCGCRFSACPFWSAVVAEVQHVSGVQGLSTGDAVGRRLLSRLRIESPPCWSAWPAVGHPYRHIATTT
jgi:hypothetical protein